MVTRKHNSPRLISICEKATNQAPKELFTLAENPKESFSLREAIDLLREQILSAFDRGYTYAEVSQVLMKDGVKITPSTLKYYLFSGHQKNTVATQREQSRISLALPDQPVEAKADSNYKPIWEFAEELTADLPLEVLENLPHDLAEQHDHYLYGLPKRGA